MNLSSKSLAKTAIDFNKNKTRKNFINLLYLNIFLKWGFGVLGIFSHNHNTFDKKRLLENMHPQYCKESPKTVEDFIRCSPLEDNIKQFFVNDIDNEKYFY